MPSSPKSLPRLNAGYVCVASKGRAQVAALISSYFSNPGEYFIVFTFPDLETPPSEKIDLEQDNYFAQLMGTQAAVRINNALARLQPRKVFLAGLNEVQKSYLRGYIPNRMIIEVDKPEDVAQSLASLSVNPGSVLACRSSEMVRGLVLAKYENKRLRIDETAPILPDRYQGNRIGLVVIENNETSDEVIAVNYAFSIGADVALVKPIHRTDLRPVQKLIHEWKRQDSSSAYQELRGKLVERTAGINFFDYQFATFFTLGFPYGLLLNNMIPFAHVLIHPGCDLFILNNIASELYSGAAGSALVFSPKLFQREETDEVVKELTEKGYLVRALLGDKATVNALANYGEHFPYDLLHICSHGGETDGYYVVQEFFDRMGKPHTLEYEEIVGFSPAGQEQVAVTRKLIFRKFDGMPWMTEELNKLPSYVFEDMRKALPFRKSRPDPGVKRKQVHTPIYTSCHIKCADSIHQGEFQSLASNSYPTIFNNTCSSWYEIAITFIAAGARAYVGTLWAVDNAVARKAAGVFYKHAFTNGNLLDSFYEMTREIQEAQYRSIYLYWGLHFNTLKTPTPELDHEVFKVLIGSLIRWRREYDSTTDDRLKRECYKALSFISHELRNNFKSDHLERLSTDIRAGLPSEETEPPESGEPERDPAVRGVIDLSA
jgi:hypothetical protein